MIVHTWALATTAAALAVTGPALVTAPAASAGGSPRLAPSATQTWGPVTRLARNPRGQSLAVDARNNATVVWATSANTRSVMARRRAAGHGWGAPQVIGHGYAPQVATDTRGDVTAVWLTQRKGFTDGVAVARRPAGGHWSGPVRLTVDRRVPAYPHGGEDVYGAAEVDLAVSPRGAVVVTWAWGSDDRKKPWRIQSAYRRAGGGWSGPDDVTPVSGARSPRVGIDARGRAVLVYGRQRFGHPQVLEARRRLPGARWTRPTTVAAEGYGHSLAVDRAGNAVVVFTPDFTTVQAASRPAAGRWRALRTISPEGVEVEDYDLAMNGRGVAVVALGRGSGRVDLVRRPPRGPWSEPVRVARPGAVVYDVLVALNGSGDTFLGWGDYALYGAYRPVGGGWSERFTISPDAGVEVLEATAAEVARNGDVVVMWKQEGRPLKVRVRDAS